MRYVGRVYLSKDLLYEVLAIPAIAAADTGKNRLIDRTYLQMTLYKISNKRKKDPACISSGEFLC